MDTLDDTKLVDNDGIECNLDWAVTNEDKQMNAMEMIIDEKDDATNYMIGDERNDVDAIYEIKTENMKPRGTIHNFFDYKSNLRNGKTSTGGQKLMGMAAEVVTGLKPVERN